MLQGICRRFTPGEHVVTALDDVSVEFAAGTFTAIMGPSGSGKSTLMHCAAGLDRPDEGTIRVGDVETTSLDERTATIFRRRQVGFVFQAFNLVPSLTAEQNVALPMRLDGRKPEAEEITAALDLVGLGDRAAHLPSELSGGQQQRVAIARALICRPSVLFADEPTGALDITSSRTVLRQLRDLVDRNGQTVVTVTHDPVVAAAADRVLFLADGRVVDEFGAGATAQRIGARMTEWEA
ncbi:ATP-binding cassette domain-containing protein [Rhodococcus rhodochrous]|uniref:Putative ABC transport system ATP-binding protein n=1 Tax=Rhodococcus rhodochrous J45 TaxID=935266 RepID=A0A562EST9_RHORH|nr:ATP-binding cassette domain-containing protein [Rhodococcus rhodochrous]TWH25100.1 putative ABC transport system ATP-binding protein [Rhodococcus rhodochrous J45]